MHNHKMLENSHQNKWRLDQAKNRTAIIMNIFGAFLWKRNTCGNVVRRVGLPKICGFCLEKMPAAL